jgi:hypothetical protein
VAAGLKAIAGVKDVQIHEAHVVAVYYDPQQADADHLLNKLNVILAPEAGRR